MRTEFYHKCLFRTENNNNQLQQKLIKETP